MSGKGKETQKGLGRDFWWYRGGEFLSDLGTSAQTLAVAWWVLDMTGSAASMATVLVPTMLANIIFSPLLAPLGDRYSRRAIMLWANAGKIVTVAAMASLFFTDNMTIPLLISLSVIASIFASMFNAGSEPIVSNLVEPEQFQRANQSVQALDAITLLLGGVFGATMVATLGIKGAVLVNLVSFLASVLGLSLIRKNTKPKREDQGQLTVKKWREDIYQGFRAMIKIRIVLSMVLCAVLINMAINPIFALMPYLVKEVLGLTPYHVGILEAAIAVGALLASVSLSLITKNVANNRIVIGSLCLAIASLVVVMSLQSYWLLVVGFGVTIMAATWNNILMQTQLTLAIPDHFRSRILSAMGMVASAAIPLGVSATGFLIDIFGPWSVFLACSGVAALTLPVYALVPNMTAFLNTPAEEIGDWVKETYPDAFDEPPAKRAHQTIHQIS
ncbi:MFS transporter [Veronia pacifica]|uniref:Major facilitator superfamily (MFS) profile domain-containing protein n=1 Tax=Veronia pacifica TaxID=1080227 RepID=A0A1C3E957_9GAMM|nr:MFS transporter [Veronia pacifica]ODA29756.1 hypothetical protein A8L45_21760 [Veronia pacifica]